MPVRALTAEYARIENAANVAIKKSRKADIGDAVNWGDLSVREVSLVLPKESGSYWLIEIEEAAPEAERFCAFIAEQLRDKGFGHVVVKTEW